MIVLLSASKPTFRKWVWKVMESLALRSVDLMQFAKRKRNLPPDAICAVSVDGTDFKVQEPFPFDRKWMTHKCQGAGLKCEVGISVFSGDIVWVCGPHRGAKHDPTILREKLMHPPEEGEIVEADSGCVGEADWIRARDDCATVHERREKNRLHARHETCDRRFKCWGILKQEHRHDITKHELVFRSMAVLTQLGIDNGQCLFGCEPTTKKTEENQTHSIDDINLDAWSRG